VIEACIGHAGAGKGFRDAGAGDERDSVAVHLPQRVGELDAVQPGKADVEDRDIRFHTSRLSQPGRAIVSDVDVVSFELERERHHVSDVAVVFDEENAGHGVDAGMNRGWAKSPQRGHVGQSAAMLQRCRKAPTPGP